MEQQIDYAANGGLTYWAFCWYYPPGENKDIPNNNTLGLWQQFTQDDALPYIPDVTTGWDKRPWEKVDEPQKNRAIYYTDRSPELVGQLVSKAIQWVKANPTHATAERLVMLYAWNENGEGGYLTPTRAEGTAYLDAIARTVKQ